MVRKGHYFLLEVVLGCQLAIEESVEGRVDDDLLLPVLHRLLVFIITHPKFIYHQLPTHHLCMYYTSSNFRASNYSYLFSTFMVPYDISFVYRSAMLRIDFLFLFSLRLQPSKLELVYLIILLSSSRSSRPYLTINSFSSTSGSV